MPRQLSAQNTSCKSCHKPVVWVTTVDGNRMPVDAKREHGAVKPLEVSDGNIIRVPDSRRSSGAGRLFVKYVKPGEGTWRSHFATCPHAKEWRGQRR